MASTYNVGATHAVAYPSNLVSQHAGHVQSVTCSENLDNGSIVALGAFEDLDLYADDGVVTGFEAEIVKKAQNGAWYVRVKNPGNAYFIYTEPVVVEEWTNSFKSLKRFFNAKDDQARAYQLFVDDVFEVSEEAFASGTPTVGATISSVSEHKMVIA